MNTWAKVDTHNDNDVCMVCHISLTECHRLNVFAPFALGQCHGR